MPIAAARPACASPAQRRYLGIRQRSKAGHKFAVPFFLIRLAQLQHCVHGLLVRGIARLQHLHHKLLAGRTHCLGGFTRYHGIARPAPPSAVPTEYTLEYARKSALARFIADTDQQYCASLTIEFSEIISHRNSLHPPPDDTRRTQSAT